jgi:hypothetical protein
MKTFEEILQKQYEMDAIKRGDLDREDYLELDPDNLSTIRQAIRLFLEEWYTNRKVDSYEQGFAESKCYQDIKAAFQTNAKNEGKTA